MPLLMKTILLTLFGLCFCFSLWAQSEPQQKEHSRWKQGRVIKQSGDTLDGLIFLDMRKDVLHFAFRGDSLVFLFPPDSVSVVFFYEPKQKKERTIFVLPEYRAPDGTEEGKLHFVYKALEGQPISLYYRWFPKQVESTVIDPYTRMPMPVYDKQSGQFSYTISQTINYWEVLFVFSDGRIRNFHGESKSTFYELTEAHKYELKRYAKSENLVLNKLKDVVELVEHYNALENDK